MDWSEHFAVKHRLGFLITPSQAEGEQRTLTGARQVTKEEYQSVGSKELIRKLEQQLKEGGLNPYCIAVGGSTPLGMQPTQPLPPAAVNIVSLQLSLQALRKPKSLRHIVKPYIVLGGNFGCTWKYRHLAEA